MNAGGNLPQAAKENPTLNAGGNLAQAVESNTTQALKEMMTVKKEPLHFRMNTPEPKVEGPGATTVKQEPFGGPPTTLPQGQVPREANSITFEALPNAADYSEWERKIGKKIAALSNQPEKTFKWWLEYRTAATVEELEACGDFASWDVKIGSGLSDILKGELAKRVGILEEQMAQQGKMLKGRQVAW